MVELQQTPVSIVFPLYLQLEFNAIQAECEGASVSTVSQLGMCNGDGGLQNTIKCKGSFTTLWIVGSVNT